MISKLADDTKEISIFLLNSLKIMNLAAVIIRIIWENAITILMILNYVHIVLMETLFEENCFFDQSNNRLEIQRL